MNISKYFWELNKQALEETEQILENPQHPKFASRLVNLLSRCDQPKELFSLISKKEFIGVWPRVRSYWLKIEPRSDFRSWWETIYEQLLQEYKLKQKKPKGDSLALFSKIGRMIREARVENGLSQKELALRVGINQPDISMIEKGKKNITLQTLARLCKVLEIKKIVMTL